MLARRAAAKQRRTCFPLLAAGRSPLKLFEFELAADRIYGWVGCVHAWLGYAAAEAGRSKPVHLNAKTAA
ncbi:MAG: hypothetical protein ACKERG_00630 [Candidatus Hodgkinia cicadicola]